MEQQRYGFNKEQGTKSEGRGAAIFFSFYLLFHIWLGRVKAHQISRLGLGISVRKPWPSSSNNIVDWNIPVK